MSDNEYSDAELNIMLQIEVDTLCGKIGELEAREKKLLTERAALFAACDEAYQLLYHYDLARQPNGVDWGPVDLLRAEFIDKLWTAIITAEPALDIKLEPRPC